MKIELKECKLNRSVVKPVVAIFLSILVIGWIFGVYLQATDNRYVDYTLYLENQTADVVCIGSSHIYQGINPVELWDEYGITACDFSTGSQPIWYSYVCVQDAIRTQKPKLIVLDAYPLQNTDDAHFAGSAQMHLLGLAPTDYKWQALEESDETRKIDTWVNYPIFHSRYEELSQKEMCQKDNCLLGYVYDRNVEKHVKPTEYETTERTAISEKAELYLRKTLDLCKERGVDVILVNSPTPQIKKDWKAKFNYVADIAAEYKVPFFEGCDYAEEMQINWEKDFSDISGHLNYHGVKKWTRFLGDYMEDNYDLHDHRGENGYKHWEEASLRLSETKKLASIQKDATPGEYIQKLGLDEHTKVFIVLYNGLTSDIKKKYKKEIKKLGGYEIQNRFAAIWANGEWVGSWSLDDGDFSFAYDDRNEIFAFLKGKEDVLYVKYDVDTVFERELESEAVLDVIFYNDVLGWRRVQKSVG